MCTYIDSLKITKWIDFIFYLFNGVFNRSNCMLSNDRMTGE
jgi:hypothetical protein